MPVNQQRTLQQYLCEGIISQILPLLALADMTVSDLDNSKCILANYMLNFMKYYI